MYDAPCRLSFEPFLVDNTVAGQVVETIVRGENLALFLCVAMIGVNALKVSTLKQAKITLEHV